MQPSEGRNVEPSEEAYRRASDAWLVELTKRGEKEAG